MSLHFRMKIASFSKFRAHAKPLSFAVRLVSSDAISISDAIRNHSDGFGDKVHDFLRQYRGKLSESLVVQVLGLLQNPKLSVKFFIWAGRQIGYSHTVLVYDALLQALNRIVDGEEQEVEAEADHRKIPRRLLEEIKNDDREVLARLLNILVRRHCRKGWWNLALEEMGRVKDFGLVPTALTYNALLNVFLRAERLDTAELIQREMSGLGIRIDEPTIGFYAQVLCRVGKSEEALALIRNQEFTADTVIYTKMISGLSEASLFGEAIEFLDRMRANSFIPNAVTYKVLLGACLRKNKIGLCKKILDMMIPEGCFPHPKLFDSLIFAFCRSRDFMFAYNLLRKMLKCGLKPGYFVYDVLIGGICGREKLPSSNLLDLAEKAYGEMLEAGIVLNKVNVVNFARCLCGFGKYERAYCVISEMMSKGFVPDASTYAKVIKFLCNSSKFDKAFFLFESMKANGIVPYAHTYTVLIDRFCKAGLFQQGRKLFDEMLRNGCSPSVVTYTTLMHAYLKAKKVIEADKLFAMMIKDGLVPDTVTYTVLIDGHFKAGEPEKAILIYERLIGNVESSDLDMYFDYDDSNSNQPDLFTYGALVDGLCKAQKVKEAKDLFDAMTANGCEPNDIVYNALIDGLCKAGKLDEAESMFSEMSEKGVGPTMFTYGSMVDGFFKAKRLDLVMKVLSKMEENSLLPNVIIYTEMVDGLCKMGKLDEARKLMLSMEKKNCSPDVVTYNAMIDGFGKAGKVDQSLGLFREMGSKGCAPNFITYEILIGHCCAVGLMDEAHALLDEMKQTYWPIHMASYQKVIEGYSRDFLASLGILNEICGYESVPISSMYCLLIDKSLKAGRLEVALELYDKISSSSSSALLRMNMYSSLIESLASGGKVEKGFELFSDMLNRGGVPELSTFAHLIKGLTQVDRWDDAIQLSDSVCHMDIHWLQQEDTPDVK